jgi:ABC-type bacteriocin/lantibiotic exporter with double-glycine peptidase domain
VALTFEPSEDFQRSKGRRWRSLHYAREIVAQHGVLFHIILATALVQFFALSVPLLTGWLVDLVIPRRDGELLLILAAGFGVVAGFSFLSSFLRARLLLHLRTVLDRRLTKGFVDHLMDLPLSFFQRRSAGDLMMRLNSIGLVREILSSASLSALFDGVMVSGYLLLLLLGSPRMAALVLGLGLLRLAVFLLTRLKQKDLLGAYLECQANLRGREAQMFAGIETLKASGTEPRAVAGWTDCSKGR